MVNSLLKESNEYLNHRKIQLTAQYHYDNYKKIINKNSSLSKIIIDFKNEINFYCENNFDDSTRLTLNFRKSKYCIVEFYKNLIEERFIKVSVNYKI
ncbi:hypothetical protein EQG68_12815 [Flavobacterium piscinae]|uniref:Uncharacterized protein n=1 Tax=Flavobacterium piscinae TaxID=2506424 RepID=A0A4Q1KHX3_9FLAO|nr:hypothetical protein [Flavobacterium piscinae]RXR29361.1 hypothetical protein EQG68_12815 [Flavobacterium piscinae]